MPLDFLPALDISYEFCYFMYLTKMFSSHKQMKTRDNTCNSCTKVVFLALTTSVFLKIRSSVFVQKSKLNTYLNILNQHTSSY